MTPAPSPRIYFIIAREAPVAVVLRRGPTDLVQMLRWNLETDVVEPGQWLKGRVYERRCDLSPSGNLFVYFAAQRRYRADDELNWQKSTYTAISRPPYFTALALWFKGDSWSGGGLFASDREIRLNEGGGEHVLDGSRARPPLIINALGAGAGEDSPIEGIRRERDGWVVRQRLVAERPKTWDWNNPGYVTYLPEITEAEMNGIVLRQSYVLAGYKDRRKFEVAGVDSDPNLEGADLAEFDRFNSRVLFARDGCLWSWRPQDGIRQIADLNENSFEPVPPLEWATQWPDRLRA